MNSLTSGSIVALSDLYNKPVRRIIGCFNDFTSCYGLEPFKLISFNSPVLISRFRLAGWERAPGDNPFLSILLVKTTIRIGEVEDLVDDLGSARRLPLSAQLIYQHLLRKGSKIDSDTGRQWAFRQARFGHRLFREIAEESNVDIAPVPDFDGQQISDVLGIDEEKWKVFSVMVLKPRIRITPTGLLDTAYGLN